MTPDLNHKFELALQMNLVNDAYQIADSQESVEKWKKVGDIALGRGQFTLAETCYQKSQDFNSLLLFYSSYSDETGLRKLAEQAESAGKYNVAYEAAFLTSDVDRCLNILLKSKRMGEAAFFAQAYAPSRVNEVTSAWSKFLKEQGIQYQPDSLEVSAADLQRE